MKLRVYEDRDWEQVAALFNRRFAGRYRLLPEATRRGFVRDRLNLRIKDSSASGAWVAENKGTVLGFVSAHVPGSGDGVVTTPVFEHGDSRTGDLLLQTAESFLRENRVENAKVVGVSREYNVGFGEPDHMWLLNRGYTSYNYREGYGLELAIELNLSEFCTTPTVQEFRSTNEAEGFIFEFLQEAHVEGLKKLAFADWMLKGLEAPISRNPTRYPYVICREADHVIGFCGACTVNEKYGSGGFSFILLESEYHHRGIGAVMLSMALEWVKAQGARFSIPFTGVDNKTQRLYRKVGYKYCFISAREVRKRLE